MGHIYALEAKCKTPKGFRLLKIGRTSRPDVFDRIEEIKRDWAIQRDIELVKIHSVKSSNDRKAEAAMHSIFGEYAVDSFEVESNFGGDCTGDSEWFLVPTQLVKEVKEQMNQQANQGRGLLEVVLAFVAIAAFLLSMKPSQAPPPSQQSVINAEGFAGANIRDTPNGNKLGYIPNGTNVDIIERKGEWCRIANGWVYCRFVRSTK